MAPSPKLRKIAAIGLDVDLAGYEAAWDAVLEGVDSVRDVMVLRDYHAENIMLLDDGAIDEGALKQAPEQATVRRLWPSEPDLSGHLVRAGTGWAFMAGRNGTRRRIVAEIDPRPISEGGMLTLREQGQELPFRVAQLRTLS